MSTSGPPEASTGPTSVRARWCLGLMVAGPFAFALVSGAPNSPLATRLPAGVRPPSWAVRAASALGLDRAGRPALILASLLLMAGLLVAFAFLLLEARANRVRLGPVLVAAGAALAVSVAAPVLLSRDIFSYVAYARTFAVDGRNPYVTVLATFPRDPFVADTAAQWLPTHSPYGPAFTLAGAALVRAWSGSPGAVVIAYKVLAGAGTAVATACAAIAARAIRPGRASLAAAFVGLNPVLVVHTVGGGHVDALIAACLAGALALAVTERRSGRDPSNAGATSSPRPVLTVRSASVTVLLTLACLIKMVILPALVWWLWWTVRAGPTRRRRLRTGAGHVALVAVVTAALMAPFEGGGHVLAPLATPGGVESWASPARLVARGVQAVVGTLAGSGAGRDAVTAVEASFLLLFLVLFWRLGRQRTFPGADGGTRATRLADGWGATLLLLALTLPYLLPWYAAWFAPFLALMADEALLWIGAAVAGLLALTLIPADPFRGFSTWGVMLSVHYAVALAMLALLALAARRVLRPTGLGSTVGTRTA